MESTTSSESYGIKISLTGAFLFATLGLLFAIWTGSQAVLLDGAFNLISGVMALFALKLTRLLKEPFTERFPAGYVAFEPFYILIKGLILFILTAFVIFSNVLIIMRGGNELELGIIVIYIGVAVVGNCIIFALISKQGRKSPSPVLSVEKENWMVNALISAGIGVAFLLVLLFKDGLLKPVVPYVDQVVVILVGIITLSVPIKAIRNGLKELLLIAPDTAFQNKIKELIEAHLDKSIIDHWQLYILKTGRKYWFSLITIPVSEEIKATFADDIRSRIEPVLSEECPSFNFDVLITKDQDQFG